MYCEADTEGQTLDSGADLPIQALIRLAAKSDGASSLVRGSPAHGKRVGTR